MRGYKTKALIIAAGDGGRFRPLTNDTPKALIPVLGLSVLERIILTSKKAGIKDFVVILGYKGEMIKDKFGKGERCGVKITYLKNPAWRKANGLSVLVAEDLLKQEENFVLLMGDHLFDYRILKTLISQKLGKDECVLCVDKSRDNVLDFDDVTKVKVEDDYVEAIGKELGKEDQFQKDFNGFDTGIFLCSHCIFDALRKLDENKSLSLTEGVKILAEQGKMRTLDVSGNFWLDLDTASDLSVAEKRLLKSLVKPTDGVVSRSINRKISTILSRVLVKTKIKPNTFSLINFFTAIVSGLLFGLGHVFWGGIFAQLTSVLDGVDGEIARLKFRESKYGGFLDSILDRYGDLVIIFFMILYCSYQNPGIFVWVIGFLALAGSLMSMLFKGKFAALTHKEYIPQQHEGWLAYIPDGRDGKLFIIMLGGILNQVLLALIVLAVITHFKAIARLIKLRPTLEEKTTRLSPQDNGRLHEED